MMQERMTVQVDTVIDSDEIVSVTHGRERHPLRWFDNGFGPLWVYVESLGVLGACRAATWAEGWETAEDELMNRVAWDELDPETQAEFADESRGDPEGYIWSNSGGIASHDLGLSKLFLLTPERAAEWDIHVHVKRETDPILIAGLVELAEEHAAVERRLLKRGAITAPRTRQEEGEG